MAAVVFVVTEHLHQMPAVEVIHDQYGNQQQLDVQPALAEVTRHIITDQPHTEDHRGNHRGDGNAAVQLALHDLEAFLPGLVFASCVIHKQPGQVEDAGKPAHQGNYVEGFNPQHLSAPSVLVITFDIGLKYHTINPLENRSHMAWYVYTFGLGTVELVQRLFHRGLVLDRGNVPPVGRDF